MPLALLDIARYCDLQELLEYMQDHGSSVVLTFGEDNGAWECSWIVGGERYSAYDSNVDVATRLAARMLIDK